MRRSRTVLFLSAVSLLSGCQLGYVLQQGIGQLQFRSEAVPIASPDLAERVGKETANKLVWVPRILAFARSELGLDPGDSYTTYVDTHGSPVSFAVTAAHPLALIPFQWRFPFAGKVPYKGYFSSSSARAEAARLERSFGLETLVLPVAAYSTLGWFSDPIVSSMLGGTVADLVDVVLHETTHRTLYYPGQTSFNESLATFVAREGTILFLSAHPEIASLRADYLAGNELSVEREQALLRLRNDLDALYRSGTTEAAMRARKAEAFATANEALRILARSPNAAQLGASNAFILSVARYHEFVQCLADATHKLGGHPRQLVAHLKGLGSDSNPVEAMLLLAYGKEVPAP